MGNCVETTKIKAQAVKTDEKQRQISYYLALGSFDMQQTMVIDILVIENYIDLPMEVSGEGVGYVQWTFCMKAPICVWPLTNLLAGAEPENCSLLLCCCCCQLILLQMNE